MGSRHTFHANDLTSIAWTKAGVSVTDLVHSPSGGFKSSTEAKYRSLGNIARELLWIQTLPQSQRYYQFSHVSSINKLGIISHTQFDPSFQD